MVKKALRIAIALTFVFLTASVAITPAFGSTTGIIAGTVTDSATGEKLAGVNIIIEGTDLTTVTNEDGYYVITNVPPGQYVVTASLVGYSDSQVAKVSVLMDITSMVDFAVVQSVVEEEEVIVTEARPMIQRDVVPTMYIVDDEQEQMIKSQPHLLYQTPAIVMTQPGIVPDEGGYPHIRGGRSNQVGYLIDGILITESLTNGFGTNSVTVGLDKMEIYTGGYRPEYGNAISGVFNQVIKTGRTAPGAYLEMLSGSDSFRGMYPQIGGATKNGLDYYVGAYLWSGELEGQGYNEADSSDIAAKFNYPIGNKDKLTLLMASGSAEYRFPTTHTQTYTSGSLQSVGVERDHNHQSHLLWALTYNHTIDASSFVTLRPYYFRSRRQIDSIKDDYADVVSGIPYWWQDDESATNGIQLDYTNQVSQRHLLKAGYVRMASNNRYRVLVPFYTTLYGVDYHYTADTDTEQTGFYLQDQMHLSPRWRAEAGLRYDRMSYDKVVNDDNSESQWSPRLGLSYAVDPRTNLRFSYGKMIQFVYTQALERIYTDPAWTGYYENSDPRPERTSQFDLGWERQVSDDYSVQITPFYRKFKDMLQSKYLDPDNPDVSPIVFDNLGEGSSKGVELLVRKRPTNNWSGWLAYTYSKAKAESSSDRDVITSGVSQYVDWDQRHTLVFVLNYLRNGWTYSLMGEYGSGLPYNLTDESTNSRRVGSHVVFNLNISREVKSRWLAEGEFRLGVANVFNARKALDRDETGEPTAYVSPRFVNLSYVRRL